MKKIISHTAITATLLLVGLVTVVKAQQQKIGYVDTDYILSQMPEYEGIEQQLRSISSEWNKQLKEMDAKIKQMREDFQSKKVLYTEEQKEEWKQRIESKVAARRQFMEEKFGAKGEYFQKQKELLEPIQRSVFEAVQTVASREKVDFVFDRAQNTGLLYGNEEFNFNDEVLQELGIPLKKQRN